MHWALLGGSHSQYLKFLKQLSLTMYFNHFYCRRLKCNKGDGNPPIYVNVNMKTGETVNHWVDSLQAAWTAVQVRPS